MDPYRNERRLVRLAMLRLVAIGTALASMMGWLLSTYVNPTAGLAVALGLPPVVVVAAVMSDDLLTRAVREHRR